ncbi:MAG: hypothetical protein SNI45_04660 [Rikenellaceae bacterium]
MRRFFTIICFLLAVQFVYAQGDAYDLLSRVLNKIESYNPYEVKIEVSYENSIISGYYQVDGERYFISIDQQELYGDADIKYEIFNGRKEVIIDSVTPDDSGNLLSNPAMAFRSILEHYDASLELDNQEVTLLELKQSGGWDDASEIIDLYVDKSTMLPAMVIYKFGDENITITIKSISKLTSTITLYDSEKYADYEIIDFR